MAAKSNATECGDKMGVPALWLPKAAKKPNATLINDGGPHPWHGEAQYMKCKYKLV